MSRPRCVAIVGSRTYQPLERVAAEIAHRQNATIITGGAIGVDKAAEEAARKCGLQVVVYLPDYKRHPPKVAPLIRNALIADACDEMVAFWDGHSRGTLDAITKAVWLGRPVRIVPAGQPDEERDR